MGRTLRILNVEDSERDAELLNRHLATAGYELVSDRVDTPDAMKAALAESEWDIILCDYSMPHFNALAALDVLHESGLDIPFIIISGTVGEEVAVQAMLTGANDYLPKDNLTRLVPAIEREVKEAENRQRQRRTESERKVTFDIIQGAITSPNLEEFLKLVHRSISKIVYAENCIVMLHDLATDHFIYEFWADKFDPPSPPRPIGVGFSSYVLHTGQPLLLTKEVKKEMVDRGDARLSGTPSRSWLGIPLRTPTRMIGVMVVQHYETENAYDQRDVEFLSSVGDQIAIAIERQRAEDALRESESRLRAVIDTEPECVKLINADGTIAAMNPAGLRMMSAGSFAEVEGRNILDFVAEEHREAYRELIDSVFRGESGSLEFQIIGLTGALAWADIQASPMRDASGEITALLGITRDVTESKRVTEALRASNEKFLQLADNISDVFWIRSLDMQEVYYLSPAFEKIWGRSVESLLTNPTKWADYVFPEDRPRVKKAFDALQSESPSLDIEYRIVRPDDSIRWVRVRGFPVRDAVGKVIRYAGIVSDVTERKQVAEALRESEESYRELVENALDIIYTADMAGNFTSTNAAAERITGYTKEESLTMNMSQVIAPEYLGTAQEMVNKRRAGEEVPPYELELIAKDGRHIDVEVSSRIIYKNDVPVGLQGIGRDITERKKADQKFSDLLESAPDAMILVDRDGKITLINSQTERLFGWQREELLGKTIESLVPDLVRPDHSRHRVDFFLDSNARPMGAGLELHGLRKDGGEVPIEISLSPIETEKGTMVMSAIRDITERKQADEAIRDSEERFSGAFEFAPIGVALVSPDGYWLKVNRALCDLVGYSEAELLTSTFQEITHPDDLERDLSNLQRLAAGEITSYQIEKRYIHKLGHSISILLNVSLVRDANGQPRYFISQIQDITQRKELEEQFRQAQKMEAVGVLAGGIAHDFNNLLTAINGYSDLTLKRMPADDPLRHNIEEVKKAGDRAAELTGQLLAFSRKQVLKPVVLNLNSVISDIQKMLRRIIRESIDLRAVLDPDLGNIKADPGQIEQVIMNLAINARDAMPNGGTLTIETQNVVLDEDYVSQHLDVSPGEFVRLTVTDTGEGMDVQTKKRIFEPFFTTKEIGKGTGLGLSTVYGIVKQSGGDIMVYSEPGHGSTFKIYLPSVDARVEKPIWKGGREHRYEGTETILLVEDEDIVRDLVREILVGSGYNVLEAASGTAAVSICETYSETIHMLLTDVVMPKMGGSLLREHVVKLFPDIKVLFMSGYTDDTIVHRGISNGAEFIEKPFTPDELSRKVRELLDPS